MLPFDTVQRWKSTRALAHTLTCCFTSCAKVNHIYALKFHLGLECFWWAKRQTKHGCTPTAEHKGHESLSGGGRQNELSSVYSKPSKSCTLHMTHENHNSIDQNRYVAFPCHGLHFWHYRGQSALAVGDFPLLHLRHAFQFLSWHTKSETGATGYL